MEIDDHTPSQELPPSNESTSDEDITAIENEISSLSKQLNSGPLNYDAHVRLIELLRTTGELIQLREARENMSKYFPLSPALWIQWIEDEKLLVDGEGDKARLRQLFQSALKDYQSVDIWLEYCHLAIGEMASGMGVVRSLLEEAVTSQGLNFAHGSSLWEVYREFEFVVLAQLRQAKVDEDAIVEQLKRIGQLYQRQLAFPHRDMQATLEEYRVFLQDVESQPTDAKSEEAIPRDCLIAFNRALEKMKACTQFEDNLEEAGDNTTKLLDVWVDYLDWSIATSSKKPSKQSAQNGQPASKAVVFSPLEILCLLERAITDLCLYSPIWTRAVDYMETCLIGDIDRLLTTLARSIRNVPWDKSLWRRYALTTESKMMRLSEELPTNSHDLEAVPLTPEQEVAFEVGLKTVEGIYEAAIESQCMDAPNLLLIWTAYCDFWLRAFILSPKTHIKPKLILENLRSTFERAILHLETCFGRNGDCENSLYQYLAFVEVTFAHDIGRARSVWSRLMRVPGTATKSTFWWSYLEFEKHHGDLKHLLRVAGMAINSVTTDKPEVLFQTVLRTLSEAGLELNRLLEFESKIRARRAFLKQLTVLEAQNEIAEPRKLPSRKRNLPAGAVNDDQTLKRENTADESSAPSSKKPRRTTDETPDARASQVPRAFHGAAFKHDASKDDRSVFVSNLPFRATEGQITKLFSQCGELNSVRLVRDFRGRSKGYAYVEFVSPTAISAALKMDLQPFFYLPDDESPATASTEAKPGRPMFVSTIDTSRQAKEFAFSTGSLEPRKLFVRNLDAQVTTEALEKYFGRHGKVVGVRIVTYRNGTPKGYAYVEFETENEASRALVATDGVLFGSKQLSVAISKPPSRGDLASTSRLSAPGQDSSSELSGRMHTRLDFMPRNLSVSAMSSKKLNTLEAALLQPDTASTTGATVLSNDDFRKMIQSRK